MAGREQKQIYVNVSLCKYSVVRDCARARGWKLVKDKDDDTPWDLWWQDVSVSTDRVTRMHPWQKINHIPGMAVLHTKNGLARTLNRMADCFAVGYDYFPRTYVLPDMWSSFAEQFFVPAGVSDTAGIRKSKHVFIVKPAASCQGRGIYLTRTLSEVDQRVASIAQRYIPRPFLIDNLKFDLRIYVLVSCVDPLRIWLFDEGLARFATTPYAAPNPRNMADMTTHLTNYAIQKQSSKFVFNTGGLDAGDTGSKRSLTWLKTWLDAHGYSSKLVFGRIEHLINKTLIAAQPHLARMYRSAVSTEHKSAGSHARCFEVLGLDILLDSRLRPWLIEVNHSPSFTCDTPLVSSSGLSLACAPDKLCSLPYLVPPPPPRI
jgi:tubulin polyglutamylase TTLL6/13